MGNDLYFLDPMRPKGKPLGNAEVGERMDWDVSPDGSRLALIGLAQHDGQIEVLTFSDGTWHEISPEPSLGLPFFIAWVADGKGLFVASWDNNSRNLLHVTLRQGGTPDTHRLSPRNREASALTRWQVSGLSGWDNRQQRVDA